MIWHFDIIIWGGLVKKHFRICDDLVKCLFLTNYILDEASSFRLCTSFFISSRYAITLLPFKAGEIVSFFF